ncbi:uncharacterized protein TNCV_2097091 [Trichonephila clavipes]|nr:uncharacterized protein TNCV_2097091 [Trichonephila clavipes]
MVFNSGWYCRAAVSESSVIEDTPQRIEKLVHVKAMDKFGQRKTALVSSSSLDHDSKLQGQPLKALLLLQSATYVKYIVLRKVNVSEVAEWYRYRTVACFVTSSSPVSLKTRRVGQRCTLNLSRAETSSRWCGVVVRRGSSSSGVVHVT